MKNFFLILPVLIIVLTLVSTGCQKEEGTVTLGAETQKPVNDNSKVYIDNHTPCWHNADEVYINNAAYPVMAASGYSARIENVVSSSTYRAIFPAGIVVEESNIGNNASFPITLPSTQTYQVLDGVQRVDVPMGAYLTSGSTLQFHNLCSVVRVTVSNSLTTALSLHSIVLSAENAYLSGAGTASVLGSSSDCITMSANATHTVSLAFLTDNPVTVGALRSTDFDIIVPAFTTDNVTITINTTDGYYFSLQKRKALAQNTITTVTLNVTELIETPHAELVSGPTFCNAIPSTATSVVFEYNSNVSSGTLLSTTNSPYPVYGNLDGTEWKISTVAMRINANPDCSEMFFHRRLLTSINFGDGFNTSNVTNMERMFFLCSDLITIDVSHFNTSLVTNMAGMFRFCRSLTSIDVSNFNTINVTDMSYMFSECLNLSSLDLSNFNTSNVTDMHNMFHSHVGMHLTNLDLSSFNTANVTNMRGMFYGCIGLTNLDVSNFNTSNVTNMQNMFGGCQGLTSLNISNFNTSNVTDMSYMFQACSNLSTLLLNNFNTSNVTNMHGMFRLCHGLVNISGTGFNTVNVTDMGQMFEGCSNLISLSLSTFNTSNVTDMQAMFMNCSSLTILYLSNFDMSHLTTHYYDGQNQVGKYNMCSGISSFSHYCTIICPETVQYELESGTGLPTSGVTFTWVRP